MKAIDKIRVFYEHQNSVMQWIIEVALWIAICIFPVILMPDLKEGVDYQSTLFEAMTAFQIIRAYVSMILIYVGWGCLSGFLASLILGKASISR